MKVCHAFLRLFALILVPFCHAQLVSSRIDVQSFAAGSYDRYGDSDPSSGATTAGYGALAHVHGPYRSYIAFHVPPFAGTVVSAVLHGAAYTVSPNPVETMAFYSVTSAVPAVLDGGIGKTNVYNDLGSGVSYGSTNFFAGYFAVGVVLDSTALTDIQRARGADFVIGGDLLSPFSPLDYNEFISFPAFAAGITLELEVAAPAAPTIYLQPPAQEIISNAYMVNFIGVGAAGAPPLTYRWFVNGTNKTTQSYPVLFLDGLTTNPLPVFVIVSNFFGQATSSVAQIRLSPARFQPTFTNLTVRVGDSVAFQPGIIPFAYPYATIWKKDGVIFSDVQPYLNNVQIGDSGAYTVTVSNSLGVVTSPDLALHVIETPPVFYEEPFSQSIPLGSSVHLGSTAVAGPPPSYQWYFNGAPIIPPMFGTNSGSSGTGASLEILDISNTETGRFQVVASNALGMATSSVASITVFLSPPQFSQQPTNVTVYAGNYVSLSVGAVSGQPYPSLQWYHDGSPVSPNGRGSSYFFYNASSNTAGVYYCVASNASGVTTSQWAAVSVLYVAPVFAAFPSYSVTNAAGSEVWLNFAILNPPASFQLLYYETNVPAFFYGSYNSYSAMLPAAEVGQAGPYRIVASNLYGMSTSAVITLTITTSPPAFITGPVNQTVLEGANVEMTFAIGGAPPPRSYLFRGGVETGLPDAMPIDSGGGRKFVLANISPAEGGDYFVVASNAYGMATSGVARIVVQRAGPLDKWVVRNPLPQGRDLHSIVWGQGRFVAVGDNGALITSLDGMQWVSRNIYTDASLQGAAFGNGRFVVVGDHGTVLASTNGETWNLHVVDTNLTLLDVTFGNGTFLAVGYLTPTQFLPAAFRSSDGASWIPVEIPACCGPYPYFQTATFGAGKFLVLDYDGVAYTSTNLAQWVNSGVTVVSYSLGSAYLNGNFIALGYGGYLNASTDGATWGTAFPNGVNTRNMRGVAYGAGRYVIAETKGKIITSTGNLQSWTAAFSPSGDRLDDVVFANNLFVAVGENGTVLTSPDGLTWTNQTRGINADLDGLGVANGRAIAVGKSGTILTSTDGAHWDYILAPGIPAELHGVAYGNGLWVAVGDSTNIYTSASGTDWQARWPGFPFSYLKSVLYASNVWVAVGTSGQILTSPDGIAWTRRVNPNTNDLNEVAFGGGQFVVVGDTYGDPNATILVSSNGVDWLDRSYSNPGKNARAVTFGAGLFVIGLNDGQILYGTNSVPAGSPPYFSWQYGLTGVQRNLRGLTWSNDLWVAVGNNGTIITSPDAQVWHPRLSPTFENLHAVRLFKNTFIAIGNEGVILQSAPLTSQLLAERAGSYVHITFSSPHDGVSQLQQTADFNWQNVRLITNVVGTVEMDVPLPAGAGQRFYRVVAP